jgi:hypothetical protein
MGTPHRGAKDFPTMSSATWILSNAFQERLEAKPPSSLRFEVGRPGYLLELRNRHPPHHRLHQKNFSKHGLRA